MIGVKDAVDLEQDVGVDGGSAVVEADREGGVGEGGAGRVVVGAVLHHDQSFL